MDTREAEAAKDRAAARLMAIDGVCGVGVTESAGQPAIMILVTEATPEVTQALPDQIEGHPVVIHDSGGGIVAARSE
ncbi:MAG: hypothetical protein DI570_23470 [Phenylobacterium zucineum]|nr:MAG: hypothetical protein DI570_23470 [Phenylobacterium zucineum]